MDSAGSESGLRCELERTQTRLRELERSAFLNTERLQALLDAQQEVGEYLKEICRVMPGALLIVDSAGTVCDLNDETTTLLGYGRDELEGSQASKLFEPESALDRSAVEKLVLLTGVQRCERTCKTHTGELVPVLFSVAPLGAGSEAPGLVCVLTDLRERKRLEIELAQAQKLESVGRLAAGVAHEINTPVQFVGDSVHFVRDGLRDLRTVIDRYRDLARSVEGGKADPGAIAAIVEAEETADLDYLLEQMPRALERALDGAQRVTTIVRSLKEFAHPDGVEKSDVDLNRMLESTLVIAKNEYKYVADVITELGALPSVRCRAGELNQVFLNIIVNAAHAIAEAVAGTKQRGLITVRSWLDSNVAVVSITDTGAGVPEQHRGKLFEQFFTTKPVGQGTGQGLAIARSVVTQHGGSIDFESEIGRGTTFFVRLPVGARAG